MQLKKQDPGVWMKLEECSTCGQYGTLNIHGQELYFATTYGCGDFFGRLLGILCYFLDGSGHLRPKMNDRKAEQADHDKGCRLHATICWNYLGDSWTWHLIRDVTDLWSWHQDSEVIIQVSECIEGKKREYQVSVNFKALAYAVSRCATETIKHWGFMGYYHMAEDSEDFDMRQFLFLKAYALNALKEMHYTLRNTRESNLAQELELLMFDM